MSVPRRYADMAERALYLRARGGRNWGEAAQVALNPVFTDMDSQLQALQRSHKSVCDHPEWSSSVCPTCYAIEYALGILHGSAPLPIRANGSSRSGNDD